MVGLVQGRVATRARVDTLLWVVLVEFSRAGGFGSFFAEDAELF